MKNTISGNEGRGFMKLIVDADTDRVLGVHLIGPECAEIIQARPFGNPDPLPCKPQTQTPHPSSLLDHRGTKSDPANTCQCWHRQRCMAPLRAVLTSVWLSRRGPAGACVPWEGRLLVIY